LIILEQVAIGDQQHEEDRQISLCLLCKIFRQIYEKRLDSIYFTTLGPQAHGISKPYNNASRVSREYSVTPVNIAEEFVLVTSTSNDLPRNLLSLKTNWPSLTYLHLQIPVKPQATTWSFGRYINAQRQWWN